MLRKRKYEEIASHIAELEAENARIDQEIEEAARPAPPKKKPMFTAPILDAPTVRLNAALRHRAEVEKTLLGRGAVWPVSHHDDIRPVNTISSSYCAVRPVILPR